MPGEGSTPSADVQLPDETTEQRCPSPEGATLQPQPQQQQVEQQRATCGRDEVSEEAIEPRTSSQPQERVENDTAAAAAGGDEAANEATEAATSKPAPATDTDTAAAQDNFEDEEAAVGLRALAAGLSFQDTITTTNNNNNTTTAGAGGGGGGGATGGSAPAATVATGSAYWLEWPPGSRSFALALSKQNFSGSSARVTIPKSSYPIAAALFGTATMKELENQSDDLSSKKVDVVVQETGNRKNHTLRVTLFHRSPGQPQYLSPMTSFFNTNNLQIGDVLHFQPKSERFAELTIWKGVTPIAGVIKRALQLDGGSSTARNERGKKMTTAAVVESGSCVGAGAGAGVVAAASKITGVKRAAGEALVRDGSGEPGGSQPGGIGGGGGENDDAKRAKTPVQQHPQINVDMPSAAAYQLARDGGSTVPSPSQQQELQQEQQQVFQQPQETPFQLSAPPQQKPPQLARINVGGGTATNTQQPPPSSAFKLPAFSSLPIMSSAPLTSSFPAAASLPPPASSSPPRRPITIPAPSAASMHVATTALWKHKATGLADMLGLSWDKLGEKQRSALYNEAMSAYIKMYPGLTERQQAIWDEFWRLLPNNPSLAEAAKQTVAYLPTAANVLAANGGVSGSGSGGAARGSASPFSPRRVGGGGGGGGVGGKVRPQFMPPPPQLQLQHPYQQQQVNRQRQFVPSSPVVSPTGFYSHPFRPPAFQFPTSLPPPPPPPSGTTIAAVVGAQQKQQQQQHQQQLLLLQSMGNGAPSLPPIRLQPPPHQSQQQHADMAFQRSQHQYQAFNGLTSPRFTTPTSTNANSTAAGTAMYGMVSSPPVQSPKHINSVAVHQSPPKTFSRPPMPFPPPPAQHQHQQHQHQQQQQQQHQQQQQQQQPVSAFRPIVASQQLQQRQDVAAGATTTTTTTTTATTSEMNSRGQETDNNAPRNHQQQAQRKKTPATERNNSGDIDDAVFSLKIPLSTSIDFSCMTPAQANSLLIAAPSITPLSGSDSLLAYHNNKHTSTNASAQTTGTATGTTPVVAPKRTGEGSVNMPLVVSISETVKNLAAAVAGQALRAGDGNRAAATAPASAPQAAPAAADDDGTKVEHQEHQQNTLKDVLSSFLVNHTKIGVALAGSLASASTKFGFDSDEFRKAMKVAEGAQQHMEWALDRLKSTVAGTDNVGGGSGGGGGGGGA